MDLHSTSSLPLEVLLKILQPLQDDMITLKACSLVNSVWLVAGRQLMFHNFGFSTAELCSGSKLPDDLAKSAVLGYVRNLSLDGLDLGSHHENATLLSRIATMDFVSNISLLSLTNMSANDPLPFLQLVSSCSQLETLLVDHVSFVNRRPQSQASASPLEYARYKMPPNLRRVRFRHSDFPVLTRWILAHEDAKMDVPKIIDYAVYPVSGENVWALKGFFNARGCYLQRFAIQHAILDQTFDVTNAPECNRTVAPLTDIRTAYVGGFIKGDDDNSPIPLAIIYLRNLRSYALDTLVLELKISRVGQIDEVTVPWVALDDLFTTGTYYSKVSSIIFQVTGKASLDGVTSLISTRLPHTLRRGVLRFTKDYISPL